MPRKKTKEEYIKELAIVNPNVELDGEYINASTKAWHKCKIDSYRWESTPASVLYGRGCKVCGLKSRIQKRSKTHEQYISDVAKINPNLQVIGIYINNHTKILHICKNDGYNWMVAPNSVLDGQKCPMCSGVRRRTQEEYINDVMVKNPHIKVLGDFINVHTKIDHECLVCGNVWPASPHDILSGGGCPLCALRNKTMSHEEYVDRLTTERPEFLVLGKYINSMTPILHRCLIDGHEWDVRPHHLLAGQGCPECDRRNRTKYHEQYVGEVAIVNPNIEILGTYINNKTPILCRCKIDDHIWSPRADSILFDVGCPMCNFSHGEKEVASYLVNHKITFVPQYTFDECKNMFCLPFDFYVPELNLCIEYDGEQHFRPIDYWGGEDGFRKRVINDSIKDNFCAINQINLLRIRYDQNILCVLDEYFSAINNTKLLNQHN